MESFYQLDPVHYYMDALSTNLDWPALEVPQDLDVPPNLQEEPDWDIHEWVNRGLATNYATEIFTPSLNADNILRLWREVDTVFPLLPVPSQAMRYLLSVAQHGYSSQLSHIQPSHHPNICLEPRLWTPAVLVLNSWLKKGFLKGPFDVPPFSPPKINGLLGIPKGESNVRLCTDLSRPSGASFNSTVNPNFKATLPLRMSDFRAIKRAISLAGSGCCFLKHDLVDAYKRLSVDPRQLPAQQFKFGSCYFYDSCLLFGDVSAVHGFSFIHNGIVMGLVLPFSTIPLDLSCLCIDDLVVFAPASQIDKLWTFDARYRFCMSEIGFPLQTWDDDCMKSFGPTQEGLVLGVWINTKTCTYTFPPRKLDKMIEFVEFCFNKPALTLNLMQKIVGKVQYLRQIDDCFATTTGFICHQLQAYLRLHPHWEDLPISSQPPDIVLSPASRNDLLILRGLLKMLKAQQFPMDPHPWQQHSRIVYTDASGVMSQGVGAVLLCSPTKAFSIPLPDALLLSGLGHIKFIPLAWRTAVLELLPIWASLLMFANDLKHSQLTVYTDNVEAALAMAKRTSADFCSCLLVRLICFTASILDVHLQVLQVNRRTCSWSKIADDLTHFNTRHLFEVDPFAVYTLAPDLPPVLKWFDLYAASDPTEIFRSVLDYIANYTAVSYLLPGHKTKST